MAVGSKDLTTANLRGFDDERLVEELRKAKEELFNLRFQSATGQLESHGRLRAVKKDIARIYTIMRERELGITSGPEAWAGGRPLPPRPGPRSRVAIARHGVVTSSATRWTRPSSSPSRTASST